MLCTYKTRLPNGYDHFCGADVTVIEQSWPKSWLGGQRLRRLVGLPGMFLKHLSKEHVHRTVCLLRISEICNCFGQVFGTARCEPSPNRRLHGQPNIGAPAFVAVSSDDLPVNAVALQLHRAYVVSLR